MINPPSLFPGAAGPSSSPPAEAALRERARALEATFLAEMLNHAGLGRTPEAFGGGPGEDAFAGLLVREQASLLAERGGIGLAEAIYAALVRPGDGA